LQADHYEHPFNHPQIQGFEQFSLNFSEESIFWLADYTRFKRIGVSKKYWGVSKQVVLVDDPGVL